MNHAPAFSVHHGSPKIYTFQVKNFCTTPVYEPHALCFISQNVAQPGTTWLVLVAIFVTVPWESSADSCAWLSNLFEVHELGIYLGNPWEQVLFWISIFWDTVVAENLNEESRFFSLDFCFTHFFPICCIINWPDIMHVSCMYVQQLYLGWE